MYAPVIEIVVAMVIKAPHPPSLWSDSGVSAGVVDREEWNTINVFRSMKIGASETKKRLAPCQAVVIDRHFDFSNVSRECYKPIAI